MPEANAARASIAVSAGYLVAALLGAIVALVIALIVGEGPRTDAFFTAYSIFLFFSLFGASLRVAVVPLLGSVADEPAWRRRAADVLGRLAAVAVVGTLLVAALAPVLATLLTPGLEPAATRTAAASLALLAVAAYCQIAAAVLAAALASARRFAVSAGLYVIASMVTLVSATGLMLGLGILGAPLGVLAGSLVLLATHRGYLNRFGFRSSPALRSLAQPETWRLTALSSGAAAIPLVQQLQLTIALVAVSGAVGAVTAYTYAYFVAAVMVGVTLNSIAFVMLPGVVTALAERGPSAARQTLDFAVPTALFLFVPVAAAYACFGRPVVDAVLGGSLSAENIGLLWDASRIFLAGGIVQALLAPAGAVLLAMRRLRALVVPALILLPIHAVAVLVVKAPVAVAVAHTALTAVLVVPVLMVGFGRREALRAAGSLVRAVPAVVLAAVVVVPAVLLPDPAGPWTALGLGALGVGAYLVVGVLAWPSVGGRAVRMLVTRTG
ncbi:MAG TPA: lipid II flippase MurJ [Solirubrobacteraceae bacterium]|nr:lipid II flippase MurJ [Solirubrobacteraceae bacterium]